MSYAVAWVPGAVLLGTVLSLLIVPSVALIGLVVVAVAAVMAVVALAGAMLAMPYVLVRSLRRRLAKRRQLAATGCLTTRSVTDESPRRSQLVGPRRVRPGCRPRPSA